MPEAPKAQYIKIDSTTLTRFFQTVKAKEECPVCGNASWSVVLPPDREVFTLLSLPESGNMLESGSNFPVVGVACNQCFFIRFHAAVPLIEWFRQNPRLSTGVQE